MSLSDTLNLGTDLNHEPAANNPAFVILSAPDEPGKAWVLGGLAWSYSSIPTGGNLLITNGGITAFALNITTAGAGVILYPRPVKADPNAEVVITLAAGGVDVFGKINVLGARID